MPREKNNKVCVGLTFLLGLGWMGGGEQKKNTPTGFLYILRFASLLQGVHTYFMIISFHLKYMFLMEENQAVTSMLRVVMTKIPNKSLGFNHLRRISADLQVTILGVKMKITV